MWLQFKNSYLLIFLFILNFNSKVLSSNEIKIDNVNNTNSNEFIKTYANKSDYILDTGDILNIQFSGLELFSGNYVVDSEGYIFLPEIFNTYIKGFTVEELKSNLTKKYDDYIKDPIININIIRRRPISVTLLGAVRRPGLYYLSNQEKFNAAEKSILSANRINLDIASKPNTLYDAIRLGKGLKPNADLSNITVNRKNANINGGGRIEAKINLLNLLKTGNQEENIELNDGDIINVPEGNNPIKEQFLTISRFNISPDEIRVYVNGNVKNPGSLVIPQGSTLFEAIAYAGGEENATGIVKLIRFDESLNAEKKKIYFNELSNMNSQKNLFLIDGDIIRVEKNLIGKIGTSINTIAAPIISSFGIYSLLD